MDKTYTALFLTIVWLGITHSTHTAQTLNQEELNYELSKQIDRRNIAAIEQLLDAGANPNTKYAPLSSALFSGRKRVNTARVLLQAGASPDFLTVLGRPSIEEAENIDTTTRAYLPFCVANCIKYASSRKSAWEHWHECSDNFQSATTLLVEYGADYPAKRWSLWKTFVEKLLYGKTTVGMFMHRKEVLEKVLHSRMQEALQNEHQQSDMLIDLICDFADVPQTQRPFSSRMEQG